MKPPIESLTNSPQGANGSANRQPKPSSVEPPKEPFINLSGDGPVDPARFQKFIVPMEFIEKANSIDLSQVDSEGLQDTAPPNRPLVAPEDNPTVSSPSEQETVVIAHRRKSAPIPKEVLDKPPVAPSGTLRRRQVILAFAVAVVFVLSWVYWQRRGASSDRQPALAASVSSVILIPAPSALPAASTVREPHKSSQTATGTGANEQTHSNINAPSAASAARNPAAPVKSSKSGPGTSTQKSPVLTTPATSGVVPVIQAE